MQNYYSNNLIKILLSFENMKDNEQLLSSIKDNIDWNEKTTHLCIIAHRHEPVNHVTRNLLFQVLSEDTLIKLISPAMYQGEFNTAKTPIYELSLLGKFNFLKEYIKEQQKLNTEKNTQYSENPKEQLDSLYLKTLEKNFVTNKSLIDVLLKELNETLNIFFSDLAKPKNEKEKKELRYDYSYITKRISFEVFYQMSYTLLYLNDPQNILNNIKNIDDKEFQKELIAIHKNPKNIFTEKFKDYVLHKCDPVKFKYILDTNPDLEFKSTDNFHYHIFNFRSYSYAEKNYFKSELEKYMNQYIIQVEKFKILADKNMINTTEIIDKHFRELIDKENYFFINFVAKQLPDYKYNNINMNDLMYIVNTFYNPSPDKQETQKMKVLLEKESYNNSYSMSEHYPTLLKQLEYFNIKNPALLSKKEFIKNNKYTLNFNKHTEICEILDKLKIFYVEENVEKIFLEEKIKLQTTSKSLPNKL